MGADIRDIFSEKHWLYAVVRNLENIEREIFHGFANNRIEKSYLYSNIKYGVNLKV